MATSATDEMYHGSLAEAERQLALAARVPEPAERRAHFLVRRGLVRLLLARRRGDLPAVVEEAERLLSPVESLDAVPLGLHEDLRAIALVNLGIAELWTARLEPAERHIEPGLVLARRIERPFMEVIALAHGAIAASFRSFSLSAKLTMEAIEVAPLHGWSDDPVAGLGYAVLAARVWRGRLQEAEPWLDRAGRTLRAGVEPAAGMVFHGTRGLLESARSCDEEALAAFRAAELLADLLVTRHTLALHIRAHALQALVRMGESERVEEVLAEMGEQERETAVMRAVIAPCGSPRTTQRRRRPRSRPCLTAPFQSRTLVSGCLGCVCSKRSRARRSATRMRPSAPSSAGSMSARPRACCCRSSSIPGPLRRRGSRGDQPSDPARLRLARGADATAPARHVQPAAGRRAHRGLDRCFQRSRLLPFTPAWQAFVGFFTETLSARIRVA